MTSFDKDDPNTRLLRISRLAALQKLREQAEASDKQAMLKSINNMIEAELRSMKVVQDDGDPIPAHREPSEGPRAD